MPTSDRPLIVFVSCPPDAAETLAEALVASRTAACVQALPPMRSVYRWRGQIERSDEVLLLIKTDAAHYPALEQAIRSRHPYELPEIAAVSIERGLPDYLQWISDGLS